MSTEGPGKPRPKNGPPHGTGVGGRCWAGDLMATSFGRSFWGFAAFAVLSGLACYIVIGPKAFLGALEDDLVMVGNTIPRVVAAMAIAGLIWVMLPRDRLTSLIGRDSGLRGLIISALAGVVTPGGPASAFSLLAVLGGAGADRGVLVAYIASWSMLGVQRILVWDIPMMGAEFSMTRFLVSLPLPIIAGLLARRLPFDLVLAEHASGRESRR